jgi:hypothetical protein
MKKKVPGIGAAVVAIIFKLTGSAADTVSKEDQLWMDLLSY